MSGLQLHLYNDRELTDKEITLQKFFEDRDREHQRKLEMKQRKRLSSVDDFLQDSGRAAPLKATKKTPLESSLSERDKFVQAELLQHKKKGLMAAPTASVSASETRMDLDKSVAPSVTPVSSAADMGNSDVKKPGKSTYHISSRQKQPVQQQDTDEPPSSEPPSSTTSSLIGKRARDPSSAQVDDTPPVEVPPDELDPGKFPPYNLLLRKDWSPLLACAEEETDASRRQQEEAGEGAREFILPDFSLLKNQTLAFKVPPSALLCCTLKLISRHRRGLPICYVCHVEHPNPHCNCMVDVCRSLCLRTPSAGPSTSARQTPLARSSRTRRVAAQRCRSQWSPATTGRKSSSTSTPDMPGGKRWCRLSCRVAPGRSRSVRTT
mmetsp:Transcript_21493/g.36175  ORF Transcript_21493/g.36175 Transcript_21493/m.36175 type:complete len:379 (-) Transcript_21493:791-1927(-)